MAKILVVDDEVNILELMLDVLKEAGHEVTGVRDGQAAIEIIQQDIFDAVFLDVKMPKVDGYRVASFIKGLTYRPHVAIVTSRDFDRDQTAVKACGVEVFISKPFANKDLTDAVDSMLRKK